MEDTQSTIKNEFMRILDGCAGVVPEFSKFIDGKPINDFHSPLTESSGIMMSVILLMYRSNKEQVKGWLLSTLKEYDFNFEVPNEKDKKRKIDAFYFYIYFVRSLDSELLPDIFDIFLNEDKFDNHFIINDCYPYIPDVLFAVAPIDYKKKILDKIIKKTRKKYRSKSDLYIGKFIESKWVVRSSFTYYKVSSEVRPHYYDFFSKLSAEDHAIQGVYLKKSINQKNPTLESNTADFISASRWILKFHPDLQQDVFDYFLECVDLIDVSSVRYSYILRAINDHDSEILKKRVVAKILQKTNAALEIPKCVPKELYPYFERFSNLL